MNAPARAVELLYFDGCPNKDALLPHLRELLAEAGLRSQIRVVRVSSEEDAERLRFLGSPTVRVDGRDVEPGADRRRDFGMKCRLYRTAEGVTGVPPDAWIIAALGVEGPRDSRYAGAPTRSDLWMGRSIRERLGGTDAAHRELHRRVLRSFLDGRTPSSGDVRRFATDLGAAPDDAIAELERRDVLWLDRASGAVAVAYPFSGSPTAHEVELADDTRVFAMCAVDALGIPFLADRAAVVRSRDPLTGEHIEVRIDPLGASEWTPTSSVVVLAEAGEGPSASSCCPHVHFVSSHELAESLLDGPPAAGAVVEMPEAIDLGRRIFEDLLLAQRSRTAGFHRLDITRPCNFARSGPCPNGAGYPG